MPNVSLALRNFSELAGQDAGCRRDGGTGGNTVRFIRPYRAGVVDHVQGRQAHADKICLTDRSPLAPAQCGGALAARGGTMPA